MTDKLELKSSHEVIDTVNASDVDSIFHGKPTDPDILTVVMKDGKRLYCDEVCPIDSSQEEPVSEELEEAALFHYPKMSRISEPHDIIPADNESHYIGDANEDNRKAFKAGAKWQEKKDQETIETAIHHAYHNGRLEMKEQMMAKAIDAHCFGFQGAALFTFRLPAGSYLVGSEVKVIVIKED